VNSRGLFAVAAATLLLGASGPSAEVVIPRGLPAELWRLLTPDDNPVTPAKIALGRRLFHDPRLSADGNVSCATCHDPARGFADGRKVSEGVFGRRGARNTPTILGAAFAEFQFWDGRSRTLEEQAKQPLTNPAEMGMKDHDAVVAVVLKDPSYVADFKAAFNRAPAIDDIAAAIATFERVVLSGDSPFDRFRDGNPLALSEPAQRGLALFNGKARCNLCHPVSATTPTFTDNRFHNTGVGSRGRDYAALAKAASLVDPRALPSDLMFSELGRFNASGQPVDLGGFKTPGLRDVALTAPYMHDGSQATLLDVVAFYERGGEPNPFLDMLMVPLKLTDRERHDLVAFMESLTGQGEGASDRPALRAPKRPASSGSSTDR
jgi:cytochrome c peroxidase